MPSKGFQNLTSSYFSPIFFLHLQFQSCARTTLLKGPSPCPHCWKGPLCPGHLEMLKTVQACVIFLRVPPLSVWISISFLLACLTDCTDFHHLHHSLGLTFLGLNFSKLWSLKFLMGRDYIWQKCPHHVLLFLLWWLVAFLMIQVNKEIRICKELILPLAEWTYW